MYAFGLIIFDLYFPSIKRSHVSVHLDKKQPLQIPSHSNKDLCDLLPRLLSLDPQSRMNAKQTLSHRFFSETWEFSLGFLELKSGWERKSNRYKVFDFKTVLKEGNDIVLAENKNIETILKLMHGINSSPSPRIIRSYAIHNDNMKRGFVSRLIQMQTRLEESPHLFKQESWKSKPNSDWREWIKKGMIDFTNQFPHNQNSDLKIIPLFHGAKSEDVAWKICDNGFANLSSLDDGWYGKGIYFTSNLRYAVYYAQTYGTPNSNGEYSILLSYVLLGNTYPVIESPLSSSPDSMKGKPCVVRKLFKLFQFIFIFVLNPNLKS